MLSLEQPGFTRRMQTSELTSVSLGSLFYGADIEEDRADTITGFFAELSDVTMCRVETIDDARCRIHGLDLEINLFESFELSNLVSALNGVVAVDLTSLEHRVWAPLVRALVASEVEVVALYAEPDDYQRSEEFPGSPHDLSTSRGIEPLPGFAKIGHRTGDEGHFAPLLGFEGARLGHIFDQEEVEVAKTSPVIGSPGFRLEYPTYTYVANQDILELGHMGRRVEYARASCPFEAYQSLKRIHARIGGAYLRIAPIGTKPHALGAILYAIDNVENVEIIYDHPVRSTGRTRGSRGVYLYEISGFRRFVGVV